MYKLTILFVLFAISGCITVPVTVVSHSNKCELSSDMKILKVVNVAEETNSYYSVSGYLLSPILVPATAVFSGAYVLVNNIYHLGEEQIKCGDASTYKPFKQDK